MLLSNILTLGAQVHWQGRLLPVGPEVEHNRDNGVVALWQVAPLALVIVSDVCLPPFPIRNPPFGKSIDADDSQS